MSATNTAMILAAGRGERMRPLTDTQPKALALLGGKPLIEYHVENLAKAGIARIVVNLAWLGEQIRNAVGDGTRFGVEVLYSDEGEHALDTGGGIFRALPLLGSGPFWVVSADLWTDFPFAAATPRIASGDLGHLVMVPNPDFHPGGDFCLSGNRVTDSGGNRLTYASVAILRPELFASCHAGVFSVVPLLRQAMARGRIGGELYSGKWHNIGTVAQLRALNEQYDTGM